jgi:hypothetical protein
LASIATSAEACVQTLLGDPPALPTDVVPSRYGYILTHLRPHSVVHRSGLSAIAAATEALRPHWKCLADVTSEDYQEQQLPPKAPGAESESGSDSDSSDEEAGPAKTLHIRGPWLRKQRLLKIWRFGRKAGVMKAIQKRRYLAKGQRAKRAKSHHKFV